MTQALLAELGEPLVSSTLLLPGQDEPLTQGWELADRLGDAVEALVDSGDCGTEPTTVIDFSQDRPVIVRRDHAQRRGHAPGAAPAPPKQQPPAHADRHERAFACPASAPPANGLQRAQAGCVRRPHTRASG